MIHFEGSILSLKNFYGVIKFAPENILVYMYNPFFSPFLWYPYLWKSNWIITTSVGVGLGTMINLIINKL